MRSLLSLEYFFL